MSAHEDRTKIYDYLKSQGFDLTKERHDRLSSLIQEAVKNSTETLRSAVTSLNRTKEEQRKARREKFKRKMERKDNKNL